MKKKIVSPFVWIKKVRGSKLPNGWVMDYAVKGCRRILACYSTSDGTTTRAPVLVMTRRDARLMVKALQKALKLNRKPKNAS